MILGGLELLALPLSGVLIKGAIKFVIYIGIGGVFGVLIGALLITAGLVVWFNPTHRVFYGVAGIILGLLSFPASNLGGFILGMLLAIFGGAAAIAWTPLDAAPALPAGPLPASGDEPEREGATEPVAPAPAEPSAPPSPGSSRSGQNGASGQRLLAIAAMPALVLAGMLTSTPAKTAPDSTFCLFGVICLPVPGPPGTGTGVTASPSATTSPSVTASPSVGPTAPASPDPKAGQLAGAPADPSASASAGPSRSPSAPASASASPSAPASASSAGSASHSATSSAPASARQPGKPATSPTATAKGTPVGSKKIVVKDVAAPGGMVASSATSVLTANTATLDNFQFIGIVNLPLAAGGTEQMLEFTASSASLTGNVNVAVTQNGVTSNTTSSRLDFSGNMTLYSTKLCGDIYGITGQVCFTPSTIDQVLLRVANVLTGLVPISMTSVTTYQPVTIAGTLQTGSLSLG